MLPLCILMIFVDIIIIEGNYLVATSDVKYCRWRTKSNIATSQLPTLFYLFALK